MAAISFSTCATVSTEEVTGGSTAARARASTNASGTARPADPADPGATVRPRVTTGATFAVPAVHTGLAPHARSPGTTVARAAGSTAVAAIAAIATDTGVAGGARRTCAAAHTTRTAGTTASARRAVAAGAVVGPLVVVVAAAGALDPTPPNSRRVNANADHAKGPASGLPPVPPPVSQDNRVAANPDTWPPTAAAGSGAGAGDITGLTAAGATAMPLCPEPVGPAADSAADDHTDDEPIVAAGNGNTRDPDTAPESPGADDDTTDDGPADESIGASTTGRTDGACTAPPRCRDTTAGASTANDDPPPRLARAPEAGAASVTGAE